jgi:hypothetical protein
VEKLLPKNPTTAVETKVQKTISNRKAALSTGLKHRLTPIMVNFHIFKVSHNYINQR